MNNLINFIAESASDSPIISSYHQQDKEKVILPPEPTGAVDPDVAVSFDSIRNLH